MIKSEIIDDMVIRHWSDIGMKIKQIETNNLYNDAVDILPCAFTYEETDIPIDDVELDAEDALRIIFGEDI